MKPRVRRLIVALISLLLLLLAGGLVATRMTRARLERELQRQVADILPDVAQRIQNFHRMKVDKGRKVWEVSAREAQYNAAENMVVVHEPSVEFFLEDGRSIALAGQEGRVKLDGSEHDRVELEGEVRIQFGDYSMRTESARYDREQDAIIAPGHVVLTGATLDVQGERLELQLASQRVRLHDNVRVVVRPSATPSADAPA